MGIEFRGSPGDALYFGAHFLTCSFFPVMMDHDHSAPASSSSFPMEIPGDLLGASTQPDDPDNTQHVSASQPPALENPVEAAVKKNIDDYLCQHHTRTF